MIALLKFYKKNIQRDGNTFEAAGARPCAIYENGNIHPFTEDDIHSIFANTGKVFVPTYFQIPKDQDYQFYEVIESSTFDESKFNSCKYTLGREIEELTLFEVIDLDETIENDKCGIGRILRQGFDFSYNLSEFVIFRTADDYIIGPIKMEIKNGLYVSKESEFVPYYKQQVDFIPIIETFENQMRLFCINQMDKENLIGWIDVANEQRVISYALKELKENTELAELSRKMIARLKLWYDSDKSQVPHLQDRIQHAIRIMESHTLTNVEVALFEELVLDLEVTKEAIEKRVKELFELEYQEFLKNNKDLLREKNIETQKLENLKRNYNKKSQELQRIEKQYTDLKETMEQKIVDLQDDFTSIYAEKLTQLKLPATIDSPINNITNRGFANFQSISGITLSDHSEFSNLLNENLSRFRGNDKNGTLAATATSAVILGEPIIIIGENSFDLAKCISLTIACEQMLTVIPEIETFTLNEMIQQYSNFTMEDIVKSLIIHNPHSTGALYSLPALFKQNKWIDDPFLPNLTIISIDSLEEGLPFIKNMPYAPLINSKDYVSCFVNKTNFKALQSGQIKLEYLEQNVTNQNTLSIRREFREWIEDYKGKDSEVPYQIVEWLNQLNTLTSKNELFEWSYRIFGGALKNTKMEVKVN
ncbi:hypothetical protein ACQKFO_19110 [Rossellomorea sp. NPDC071047]|uniref:hypothetical protein n=1 Tax=Rossellomorea sp. NPDC071047 TaxID=3390675 RepID=UPI003D050A43